MKSLRLHRLCKKTTAIFLCQEIHTNHVLLARRGRKLPSTPSYEPGSKYRDLILAEETSAKGLGREFEDEDDYEDDFDFMNADRAFDDNAREQKKRKQRLGQIITAKKFFESRPQPSMLTYNERECIKYLHKQDPVQWDVQTLSESFPATTEGISKILRSKWKITPERAKNMDSRVQRNWELLAEGKLNADPSVIEHLKKFVNRREVILEQIKNEKLYLPEMKKEEVWNNGELSSILSHYEKQVKQLRKADQEKGIKELGSGKPNEGRNTKETSVESLHKKIAKIGAKRNPQEKDSFMLGEMLNYYAKEKTLDELESEVLEKAEARGNVGKIEQAILDSKLGKPAYKDYEGKSKYTSPSRVQGKVKQSLNMDDKSESVSSPRKRIQGKVMQSLNTNEREIRQSNREIRYSNTNSVKIKAAVQEEEDIIAVDSRTLTADEMNIGKLLNKLQKGTKSKEDLSNEGKVKKEIDFSDSERLERENAFYDREVEQIKNTSFWNSGRSSEEKALAENQKTTRDALAYISPAENPANIPVFSTDTYPQRIKIPAGQRGSGLTFRINDCYYDDDGEFLYRVPGMTK